MLCCPLSSECESERGAWSRCVIAGCGPGRSRSRRGPADWLRARTRDRHVAVLAQPAWVSLETGWRCCWARKWGRCWSYAGPAGCLGCARAGGRRGGDFSVHCLKPMALPWHRVCSHRPSEKAGASPPTFPLLQHRRWISCASDPGFLTEEGEGGGVRVLRGDW